MKIKLQLGILVILLAFLGTFLEQTTVPNQQIVIQFSNPNISFKDADRAIEIVKKQLQGIGVTNIKIGQYESGKLRITYYSIADIGRIQNILSNGDDGFKFDYESETNSDDLPETKDLTDFELNISEIHSQSDMNWDFEGIQIVERNQKSDRYDNPKINTSTEQLISEHCNRLVDVVIKVNKTASLERDNVFCIIPEVRAGPTYSGII